jgi:hypothetical protein
MRRVRELKERKKVRATQFKAIQVGAIDSPRPRKVGAQHSTSMISTQ